MEGDGYRSTLDLCQEYVETRNKLTRLENEIIVRTGREPEEFLDGMARLLAPAEPVDKPDLDSYSGFQR